MSVPQPHGPAQAHGRPDGIAKPQRGGLAEVIAHMEALRGLLHDALVHTAQLLTALKHQQRRSQAVQQAVRSLKDLQLDR
jgi:hypothetical protein